ncbi:hypothetical protein [Aeromicrobium sp.]
MDATNGTESVDLTGPIYHALIELARKEDALAAAEAARVPYWAPCSPSVEGHRAAAEALRAEAESLTRSA